MIELVAIYKYAFVLSPIVSAVLSLMGAHLVSRNESLQLMALSQAALTGSLFGHLFSHGNDLMCFLFSLIFFVLLKFGVISFKEAREQFYIVLYLTFVALMYLMVALFPSLDSHFTVGFFGDIVSMATDQSIFLSLIFLILLALIIVFHKPMVRFTLDKAILNVQRRSYYEEAFFTIGVLLSLYGLGLLYTLAFLIFPVLIAGRAFKKLSQGLWVLSIVSGIASIMGLAVSIFSSRVPTVPAQVLSLLVLLIVTKIVFSKLRRV